MAHSRKLVIYAALAGNSLIAITKLAAAAFTGSSAMISEGIHSLVDTGNQVLLLHGLKRAAQPPDEEFPFGHGKEIYFWSFIVAILIFAVGAGLSIYEGILHLIDPQPVSNIYVNYLVLAAAMIFEGAAWFFALKEFNKVRGSRGYLQAVRGGKDPTLFVVLFEDSAAMLGLILAFAGIWLGQLLDNPYFDGAASVAIGLLLAGTAIWLAYETKGLLIGEAAEKSVSDGIRKLLYANPQVEQVNEVLTMHMGPDYILATVGVDFADGLSVGRVEQIVASLDKRIKQDFPLVKKVFIEAESFCVESCKLD
jgi:cation diffusion facilitator family transporter